MDWNLWGGKWSKYLMCKGKLTLNMPTNSVASKNPSMDLCLQEGVQWSMVKLGRKKDEVVFQNNTFIPIKELSFIPINHVLWVKLPYIFQNFFFRKSGRNLAKISIVYKYFLLLIIICSLLSYHPLPYFCPQGTLLILPSGSLTPSSSPP